MSVFIHDECIGIVHLYTCISIRLKNKLQCYGLSVFLYFISFILYFPGWKKKNLYYG